MTKLKPIALLISLSTLGLSAATFAADAPAPAAPPYTLTANVGLYSQYVFRGLTQTNEDPAIQGGFDFAHSSGFYAGTWASNISWLKENLTGSTPSSTYKSGGSMEWDFYGGYKGSVGDFGYDVGLLYYYYPGDLNPNPLFNKADTLEAYVAGSWKWFSVKYSHSLNNETFGVADSSGTNYLDFSASVPLGDTGLTLGAHYGIQSYHGTDPINTPGFSNDALYSYDDYKISLAYDLSKASNTFSGMTVGVAYTDTSSANTCGYGASTQSGSINGTACTGVYPKNIANGQTTVWISKSF
jgi:uncharacterized protein (TIGR02001 family)